MEAQLQKSTFAFAVSHLVSEDLFSLHLEDWYSLIFVNKTTNAVVLTQLKYRFDLDDQWVYLNVAYFKTHAIYHTNVPRRMERALLFGGYSPGNDHCPECETFASLQTPFIYALMVGTATHAKNIADIGFTKKDNKTAWNVLVPALQSRDVDKMALVEPFIKSHNIEHVQIISAIASMDDDLILECLEIAKKLNIDINSVDSEGNNALFLTNYTCSSITIMGACGINVDHRNNAGDNVIDQLSRIVDNHIQGVANEDTLYEYLAEIEAFRSFPVFAEDEDAENLSMRIQNVLQLMREV